MNEPVVSPVALIPTVENWLAEVDQLFADNKFAQTTEADFRQAFAGAAAVFADWRHLSVKRVKGATYPVPYLDNLGLVPADYRILGMQVEAINGVDSATGGTGVVAPPVFFTLQRNSAGDVDALLNTDPDTILTVKASYVRTSGTDEQRIASYLELPLEDTPLDAGEVYKYTFPGGETRLVEVRHDISQFQNPTPTGLDSDPYYAPYAPLRVDTGISQEYVDAADAELHLDINDLDIRVTQVENDADALDGRMDAVEARPLPPTTTTGLAEGTNLYFTAARVLGTALASYSKAAASRAISAMDSVFVAISILEKKADDNTAAVTANTNHIGPITSLQTADKSNLVAAVNEANANNFFTGGTNGGILVLKGQGNSATNYKSSVVAGESCTASGGYTVVLGGYQNIAQANDSVIIGGRYNQTFLSAPSTYGTIIGGRNNTVRANFCTITNSTSCSIAAGCDYTTLIGCVDLNITAGSNQTYINNVLLGTLAPPTALTPTAGTVTLDFAANPRRTLAATGGVAFTTANRSTAAAEKTVRVTNAAGAAIALSYEAWGVFGAALPTSLAAGKTMILTLTCYGTSVSDVDAAAVIKN